MRAVNAAEKGKREREQFLFRLKTEGSACRTRVRRSESIRMEQTIWVIQSSWYSKRISHKEKAQLQCNSNREKSGKPAVFSSQNLHAKMQPIFSYFLHIFHDNFVSCKHCWWLFVLTLPLAQMQFSCNPMLSMSLLNILPSHGCSFRVWQIIGNVL